MESIYLSSRLQIINYDDQRMSSIDDLADERQRLKIEQRKILDLLNETKTKLRTVRDELQNLRKARDGLNDTVRALKQTRDDLRDRSRHDLTTLREQLRKMADRPHASLAEHELAQLEWKVQTDPLDKEEEKRMMLKIRSLETKVTSYHKVQKLREDITKQREDADQVHAKVQELAAESQKHHEEIVQLSEAFQTLRLRREEQEKALEELRQKSVEVNQKFLDMRNTLTEAERIIQRRKEEAHKEALKSAAKKKASQGEKLSLHELAALLGEGEE